MKLLVIGDVHHKIMNFQLGCDFNEWLYQQIVANNPDLIVFLGDYFDNHAVIRSEVIAEFRKLVDKIVSTNRTVIYLLGNHDFFKPKDSSYHALQSMQNLNKNFIVVDKSMEYCDMTFIPYIPNPDDFPLDTKEVCFAHQTFKGANYGYIRAKDAVDADLIKAKLIISGHVHKKQVLGKTFYPGSCFSQSLDDLDQSKGITLIDMKTWKQTFIESPFPVWKGLAVSIDKDRSADDVNGILLKTLDVKNKWILEISGPKAELLGYIQSDQYINTVKSIDLSLRTVFTDKLKQIKAIKATSLTSTVDEYIDKIYDGSLSKTVLKGLAHDIIKKVK